MIKVQSYSLVFVIRIDKREVWVWLVGLVIDAFPGGWRPTERGQAVNTSGIKSQQRTGPLLLDHSQTV